MADAFVYHQNLRDAIQTSVASSPSAAVHGVEWRKVMAGEPVEINPSTGEGYRVMTVEEWSQRWKQNPDFPACLGCGSENTKEHYFTQTWCRGKKQWESEILCLDCHQFTWRSYADPDFKTPEAHEKAKWSEIETVGA